MEGKGDISDHAMLIFVISVVGVQCWTDGPVSSKNTHNATD